MESSAAPVLDDKAANLFIHCFQEPTCGQASVILQRASKPPTCVCNDRGFRAATMAACGLPRPPPSIGTIAPAWCERGERCHHHCKEILPGPMLTRRTRGHLARPEAF